MKPISDAPENWESLIKTALEIRGFLSTEKLEKWPGLEELLQGIKQIPTDSDYEEDTDKTPPLALQEREEISPLAWKLTKGNLSYTRTQHFAIGPVNHIHLAPLIAPFIPRAEGVSGLEHQTLIREEIVTKNQEQPHLLIIINRRCFWLSKEEIRKTYLKKNRQSLSDEMVQQLEEIEERTTTLAILHQKLQQSSDEAEIEQIHEEIDAERKRLARLTIIEGGQKIATQHKEVLRAQESLPPLPAEIKIEPADDEDEDALWDVPVPEHEAPEDHLPPNPSSEVLDSSSSRSIKTPTTPTISSLANKIVEFRHPHKNFSETLSFENSDVIATYEQVRKTSESTEPAQSLVPDLPEKTKIQVYIPEAQNIPVGQLLDIFLLGAEADASHQPDSAEFFDQLANFHQQAQGLIQALAGRVLLGAILLRKKWVNPNPPKEEDTDPEIPIGLESLSDQEENPTTEDIETRWENFGDPEIITEEDELIDEATINNLLRFSTKEIVATLIDSAVITAQRSIETLAGNSTAGEKAQAAEKLGETFKGLGGKAVHELCRSIREFHKEGNSEAHTLLSRLDRIWGQSIYEIQQIVGKS